VTERSEGTGPIPTPPPRPTVYGTVRRGPHAVVLVALGVLLVGVLTGIVLALQSLGASDDPLVATSAAASGLPGSPVPASRPPVSSAAPAPSSPPPSSAPPAQPQQFAGVQGQGSGLCLDVQPDQPGAGGLLLLAPCGRTPSQRWQLRADGTVVNGATGLCLTVAGAATTDNGRVQQEACQAAAHQQWRVFVGADGSATFGAVHSGKCLDVAGGGTAPGTPVQQFTCNDTPAQRWLLQPE
jgi:hypothetical protein